MWNHDFSYIRPLEELQEGLPTLHQHWIFLEIGVLSMGNNEEMNLLSVRLQYSYFLGYKPWNGESFMGFIEDIRRRRKWHRYRSVLYTAYTEKESFKKLCHFCEELLKIAPVVFRRPIGRAIQVSINHLSLATIAMDRDLVQQLGCWWLQEQAPFFAPLN